MNKKNILSVFFMLLGVAFLLLPMTYYGFLDYIVENTVISMNISKDTLETEKAAMAIYSGAELTFIPAWVLNLLASLGLLSVYASIAILFVGKKAFTKEYWTTFRIKP